LTAGQVAYGTGSGLTGNSNLTFNGSALFVSNITWPAVKSASGSNGTSLDDYELGSWTPQFLAFYGDSVSANYSSREGRYQKIGPQIYIHLTMSWDSYVYTGLNYSFPFISIPVNSVGFGGSFGRCGLVVSYSNNFPTMGVGTALAASAYAGANVGQPYGITLGYMSSTSLFGSYVFGASQIPSAGSITITGFYLGVV
jgi:hypothetical protein